MKCTVSLSPPSPVSIIATLFYPPSPTLPEAFSFCHGYQLKRTKHNKAVYVSFSG